MIVVVGGMSFLLQIHERSGHASNLRWHLPGSADPILPGRGPELQRTCFHWPVVERALKSTLRLGSSLPALRRVFRQKMKQSIIGSGDCGPQTRLSRICDEWPVMTGGPIMATYLRENEVGFDLDTMGFPGLGSCMAVVLWTNVGLFGFHVYGSNNEKEKFFGDFILKYPHESKLHLYGSCSLHKRHGGEPAGWANEMKTIAVKIGYTGAISGFDFSSKVSDGETMYVEYRANGSATSKIFYKTMSKVESSRDVKPGDPPKIEQIAKRSGIVTLSEKLAMNNPITDVWIKKTPGNKGLLHEVGYTAVTLKTVA